MSPSEVRLQLLNAGYIPTPCAGKRGTVKGWPDTLSVTPELIDFWGRTHPAATNTGVLTVRTPGLDADLLDPEAVEAVERLAIERFETVDACIPWRIGRPPKRLGLFRLEGEPFKKIVRKFGPPEADDKDCERIEVLCDGQLAVVHGVHPDTKRPYEWPHGGPGDIRWEDLPPITAERAEQFMEDAAHLLIDRFGYQLRSKSKERQAGNGAEGGEHDPTDWSFGPQVLIDHDELAALTMKLVKGGMKAGVCVNFLRQNVEALTGVDPDRKARRLAEIPGMVSSAEEKVEQERRPRPDSGAGPPGDDEDEPPPLPFVDLALPLKPREWLVYERIPCATSRWCPAKGPPGNRRF